MGERKQAEQRWLQLKNSRGYALPPKAVWWNRLPIIRRLRAAYIGFQIDRHYSGDDKFPTDYDEWVLYAVARGWC